MGEIPYIGAKISLISRGDIRYEGTLYTIDMNESTIALQNGADMALQSPCAARRLSVAKVQLSMLPWRPA
jgi:hypothetical protein